MRQANITCQNKNNPPHKVWDGLDLPKYPRYHPNCAYAPLEELHRSVALTQLYGNTYLLVSFGPSGSEVSRYYRRTPVCTNHRFSVLLSGYLVFVTAVSICLRYYTDFAFLSICFNNVNQKRYDSLDRFFCLFLTR